MNRLRIASPLSKRPMRDISSAEILHLLKRVEESGRRETAKRLRGVIGSVFRLAIVTLRADQDPTIALHGALLAPNVKGRSAIIDEAKLGALLCAIDNYDGWPVISLSLNFLMLTCVRPGEVRGATKAEFDLEKATWRIPAERMKMRQPHEVPLSLQAIDILSEAFTFPGDSKYAFPSLRTIDRPLSDNSFSVIVSGKSLEIDRFPRTFLFNTKTSFPFYNNHQDIFFAIIRKIHIICIIRISFLRV